MEQAYQNAAAFFKPQDESAACKACLNEHHQGFACAESKCGPLWDAVRACGADAHCKETVNDAAVKCWLDERTTPANRTCYRATNLCYVLE